MESDKLYDMAFLNKISGGDSDFILEMVNTFCDVGPDYIEKATKMLAENNYIGLGKETHKVIPGVTFLGAKQLEGDLMLIEEYCKNNSHIDSLPQLLDKVVETIHSLIQEFNVDFNLES